MTSTLEIGDAVRVSLPGALFLHGDIQDVNESSVKVRGRWFPVETVKTEEQIEDETRENVRQAAREKEAERAAKVAAENALKSEPKVPLVAAHATGEYANFVYDIQRLNYSLRVQVQDRNFYDKANDEYSSWSGSVLPDAAVVEEMKAWGREWILQFDFDESVMMPFPIVVSGTGGGLALGEAAGILSGRRVRVNYPSIIEALVRCGLEATETGAEN